MEIKNYNYHKNVSPLRIPTQALREKAIDMASVKNVPIGAGTTYSDATPASEPRTSSPYLDWLWNTNASRRIRNNVRNSLGQIIRENGENFLKLPTIYHTKEYADTTGQCCWSPLEWALAGDKVPLRMLCLKDCESIEDRIIDEFQTVGSPDLKSFIQRQNMTARQVKVENAIESMAFFTRLNVINGVLEDETPLLKPFHGLQEVLDDPSVYSIAGQSWFQTFEAFRCRLEVLISMTGVGQKVFWMNPITLRRIEVSVKRHLRHNSAFVYTTDLPFDWEFNAAGELTFLNIPLRSDLFFAIDPENPGIGDITFQDGDSIGIFMTSPFRLQNTPNNFHIRNQFTSTNDPAQGCASDCDLYYNVGTVFNLNANHLAVLEGTRASDTATCDLTGMHGLINATTLIAPNPDIQD